MHVSMCACRGVCERGFLNACGYPDLYNNLKLSIKSLRVRVVHEMFFICYLYLHTSYMYI